MLVSTETEMDVHVDEFFLFGREKRQIFDGMDIQPHPFFYEDIVVVADYTPPITGDLSVVASQFLTLVFPCWEPSQNPIADFLCTKHILSKNDIHFVILLNTKVSATHNHMKQIYFFTMYMMMNFTPSVSVREC